MAPPLTNPADMGASNPHGAHPALLVERDNVTGIVDFELCQGGDPAQDISYWALVDDDHAPVEWLREGYEQAADLGPDFNQSLQLAMLRGCLSWLSMPTITRPDQQSFATWVIDKLRAVLTDMEEARGI